MGSPPERWAWGWDRGEVWRRGEWGLLGFPPQAASDAEGPGDQGLQLIIFTFKHLAITPDHKVVQRTHSAEQRQERMKSICVGLIYGADTSGEVVGPVRVSLVAQEPFKLVHGLRESLNIGMKRHW